MGNQLSRRHVFDRTDRPLRRFVVGFVGYFFNQVIGDNGPGGKLGSFQLRLPGSGCRSAICSQSAVSGFLGSQRIWRVRSEKPAIGMEPTAHLRDLARATRSIAAGAVDDSQVKQIQLGDGV
jgi:hypothetical protein